MHESYEHCVRFCGLECVSLYPHFGLWSEVIFEASFFPDFLGADNKD